METNKESKAELKNKVLRAYAMKGLSIENVISGSELTEEEMTYASKRMIFRIEDIFEKEKAISSVLKLIGEANIDSQFEEDKTKFLEKISILGEILIYIQG